MGSIANVIIPACNEGQAFTYHTWTQVFIDNLLSSEGIKTPWDVHPIQMADAFVEEYRSFGGVVEILGSLDGYDPMADPLIRPSIDAARERMYAWAQGVVRDAESLWNSQGGAQKNAIVDHHRACAQILFDTGRLGKLPEWMRLEPSAHELAKPCPVCRVTPKKGAALCVSQGCNYVLDPAAAFHLGMIDETSPVLERLTRLEVEELGISGFVAETADEKPARLKLGVPKPLSAFERSSLDAKK